MRRPAHTVGFHDIIQMGSLVRSLRMFLLSLGCRHFVPTPNLQQRCSIDLSPSPGLFLVSSLMSSMVRTTRHSNQNTSKSTRQHLDGGTLMITATSHWACLLMGSHHLTDERARLGHSLYSTTTSLPRFDFMSIKSWPLASFQAPRSHKILTRSCGLSSRNSFVLLVVSVRLMFWVARSSLYIRKTYILLFSTF